MVDFTIQDVIRRSKLSTPEDVAEFHRLRQCALEYAKQVYEDRAGSYNVDHEPTEEMIFGAVSLASEIHKRSMRMTGLLTPLRGITPLRQDDLGRLLDTCIDMINYASWQYALLKIAVGEEVIVMPDTCKACPEDTDSNCFACGEFANFSIEHTSPKQGEQLTLFNFKEGNRP